MRIGVFGAAGAIGRVAVPELLARGHQVRVVGRDEDRLRAAFPAGVEYAAADLSDPAGAARAARDLDAILYAVGVPYDRFAQHPLLMRTTVAAARGAGVGKLLAIGNVYAYGRPGAARVDEAHLREPHTRKGAYRKEQEDAVLLAHDPAGLRTLVLRLPDFYGPTADLSFAKLVFDAARAGKRASVLAPVDAPHEWLYVPDAAPVIADLLERDDVYGSAYNLAGTPTTTRAFVNAIYAAAGRKPSFIAAGPPLVWLLGRFDPFMRELGEMLYLQSEPVLLEDAKLRGVLGERHRTPYAQGIAATLAAG